MPARAYKPIALKSAIGRYGLLPVGHRRRAVSIISASRAGDTATNDLLRSTSISCACIVLSRADTGQAKLNMSTVATLHVVMTSPSPAFIACSARIVVLDDLRNSSRVQVPHQKCGIHGDCRVIACAGDWWQHSHLHDRKQAAFPSAFILRTAPSGARLSASRPRS